MKKVIDDITILKTKECNKSFECLGNKNQTCLNKKVERYLSGDVLFINCNDKLCHYNMSFGNEVICNCPTRKEIFNRYHF